LIGWLDIKTVGSYGLCAFIHLHNTRYSRHRMLFRQRNAIDAVQLEELRRQDARRALERECRVLRRQFAALEKDHQGLRAEHDFQSQRLDSMVVQSGALLTLINGLTVGDGGARVAEVAASYGSVVTISSDELAAMQSEKKSLVEERALLLRRNIELELQVNTVMTQFGSLLTDYEEARAKLAELKAAVAAATSIEELGGWVQL